MLNGLGDTLAGLRQEMSQLTTARQRTDAISMKQLMQELDACAELLARPEPQSLAEWRDLLERFNEQAATIEDTVAALAHVHQSGESRRTALVEQRSAVVQAG